MSRNTFYPSWLKSAPVMARSPSDAAKGSAHLTPPSPCMPMALGWLCPHDMEDKLPFNEYFYLPSAQQTDFDDEKLIYLVHLPLLLATF